MQQFGVLDDRVARVGRTAAHIGDRLAGVDAARARAESAVDLISALSLFDTDGAPALGPLFTDDARAEEAAVLTHRLLELAELGAAAGLPSCARAQARLLTYANGLENRLVTQFDAAEGRKDTAQMAGALQRLQLPRPCAPTDARLQPPQPCSPPSTAAPHAWRASSPRAPCSSPWARATTPR